MEREFLDVLDYELSVSEAELLDLHETLVPPDPPNNPLNYTRSSTLPPSNALLDLKAVSRCSAPRITDDR
jgi:hypothetical protein